jgi:ABC-type glycerol-3-phosphate transport system substrate-binding protein
MKNKKIALMLMSASMSILVLAGCGSKKVPTTTKKVPTTMKPSMKRNHDKTNQKIKNNMNKINTTKKASTTKRSLIKRNHTKISNSTSRINTVYANALKSLVTSKTITQTQSNKALTELTGLSGLVTAKTITQAQEDTVINLAINNLDVFKKENGMKVKLDGLVKSGTINQTQENAIIRVG